MAEIERMLITNGRVLTSNGDPHVPAIQDILVEDGKIAKVGAELAAELRTDAKSRPPHHSIA